MLTKFEGEAEIPDGYEFVRFGVPQRDDWYVDNRDEASHTDQNWVVSSRVILRKIPPKMVPLGPEDVIPGKTLIRNNVGWAGLVNYSSTHGCRFFCGSVSCEFVDYPNLVEKYEYSNDHGSTWLKCEKPAS